MGGARGIGAGIVERFAADGTKVVFTYAGAHDAANALVERLTADGADVVALQSDSASEQAIIDTVNTTVERFGAIDILVNNAGGGTWGPLHELPSEEIDAMINVNILGVVLATRHVIPHLRTGGRIITIGSITAERTPAPGGSIYAMTKGAVASFTRALSRELGPQEITVNNVQPGPVDTEANPADGPGADDQAAHIAVGHFGTIDDIVSIVGYLASEESRFITGASITVDGGFSA